MTHDPSELLRLADRLISAALIAEAKAKAHEAANEAHELATQQARADQARHFAGVARYFHGLIKRREKGAKFVPPTLKEVNEFVASDPKLHDWPAKDVETWWNHFETNGWKVGRGGTPMKNWQAAARNGFSYWRERAGGTMRPAVQKAATSVKDPQGWREFLKERKADYREFWRALAYLKSDFEKWQAK